MEFSEKLQQLRNQEDLTQDELAKKLYVSRTAISKWESGRGYPSIDSLKAISKLFNISIDDLLSGEELILIAENDNHTKIKNIRSVIFGILDCIVIAFIFIPLFAETINGDIHQGSLLSLTSLTWYMKSAYFIIIGLTTLFGITQLALQNCNYSFWIKYKDVFSVSLSIFGVIIFMASLQPYVSFFIFMLLIIKGVMLIKRQ